MSENGAQNGAENGAQTERKTSRVGEESMNERTDRKRNE